DKSGKIYKVKIHNIIKHDVIASIEGITDRNQAEKLKNTRLYVSRDKLPEPDDDEYYHEDLIGLPVFKENNEIFGELIAINNYGAQDIVTIKIANSGSEELYSFNKATFPVIDVKNRKIIISPPETLSE
ncbi:MAG: ribosome maturation factor RimM, partial [Pseudomonadota bacterium]